MITTRAGEYAAEWTVQSIGPARRAMIHAAPAWLRRRLVLGVGRDLVRSSYQGSRAITKMRKGIAQVDLRGSVFCWVREPVDYPLCGFYAAAFDRLHVLFNVSRNTEVVTCRGTGESKCVLRIGATNGVTAPLQETL
jgi:hypothetical protein